jgi:hypothetical protein
MAGHVVRGRRQLGQVLVDRVRSRQLARDAPHTTDVGLQTLR